MKEKEVINARDQDTSQILQSTVAPHTWLVAFHPDVLTPFNMVASAECEPDRQGLP